LDEISRRLNKMKLPIRKEYFDQIKTGKKTVEYRDAHITFQCEGTDESVTMKVKAVSIIPKHGLPEDLRNSDMFDDDKIRRFVFE